MLFNSKFLENFEKKTLETYQKYIYGTFILKNFREKKLNLYIYIYIQEKM